MEKPFFVIGSVRVGRSQSIGTYDGAERRTAIAKDAVTGPVELTPTGFTGDEQFHTHVHGGPDKAVHQYPAESYGFWRERHPEVLERFVPGAFGENLSTSGVAEGDVCIGDVVRVGSVVLELTQPREPCGTLSKWFGIADFAEEVQQTRRCGWYWRVLETGTVDAGEEAELLERPNPAWSVGRVLRLWWEDPMNRELLTELLALKGLSARWQEKTRERLETGMCEDWTRRLTY